MEIHSTLGRVVTEIVWALKIFHYLREVLLISVALVYTTLLALVRTKRS